jgi:hypothetical protein
MEKTDSLAGKKIVIADLDGTLAPSKSRIGGDMSKVIAEFLKNRKLAVISGGRYEQFQKQFVSGVTVDPKLLSNLYLFPTCATAFYMFRGGAWEKIYSEGLSENDKKIIFYAFEKALAQSGYKKPEKSFGNILDDRETQVTFSALGQSAPLELKSKWDPDQMKRKVIRAHLEKLIPQFEVNIGGATSIDVTRKGIDKAYGIRKISEYLGYDIKEMLFVGDALFEGGNDYPVKRTGIECVQVSGPPETKAILQRMIESSK